MIGMGLINGCPSKSLFFAGKGGGEQLFKRRCMSRSRSEEGSAQSSAQKYIP